MTYLAVVKQPACYNVFEINEVVGYDSPGSGDEDRKRLKQGTGAECNAFAEGFRQALLDWMEIDLEIRQYQCDGLGDAARMVWRGV